MALLRCTDMVVLEMMIMEYHGLLWRGRWPVEWGFREGLEALRGMKYQPAEDSSDDFYLVRRRRRRRLLPPPWKCARLICRPPPPAAAAFWRTPSPVSHSGSFLVVLSFRPSRLLPRPSGDAHHLRAVCVLFDQAQGERGAVALQVLSALAPDVDQAGVGQ